MDLATFKIHHPDFAQTNGDYVQAKLIEAAARMGGPSRPWPSFASKGQPLTIGDFAQAAWAGHLLLCSPFGSATRSDPDKTTSVYKDLWDDYVLCVGGGFLVAGGGRPIGYSGGPFGGGFGFP